MSVLGRGRAREVRFRPPAASRHRSGQQGPSSRQRADPHREMSTKVPCYGAPMSSIKKFQVTFDCAEPERVARFWCEVLGYVAPTPPEGFDTWDDFNRSLPPEDRGAWFSCSDPSGVGPRLFFQRVPEGKVVKNRVHLDVRAAPDSWVRSALRRLRPNAHDCSRSARYTCARSLPMTRTSRASRCRTSRATSSVSTEHPPRRRVGKPTVSLGP